LLFISTKASNTTAYSDIPKKNKNIFFAFFASFAFFAD